MTLKKFYLFEPRYKILTYILVKSSNRPRVFLPIFGKAIRTISIDPFHIVISLSNRSSIEKSIKPFLKMKGQIAY